MCLLTVCSSKMDTVDCTLSVKRGEGKSLVKDCRVVLVPLVEDIVRKKTVTVHSVSDLLSSREPSTVNFVVDDGHEEKKAGKQKETSLPISVYSKIENGIITEVWCSNFRKNKLEQRSEAEVDVDEDAVFDVVKCLLDRVSAEPLTSHTIDFASPGGKELELIKDFCREQSYEWRDYQDLNCIFTFRTIPVVEATKLVKTRSKKRKVQRRKTTKRSETLRVNKVEHVEIANTVPSNNDLTNFGLEKIENLKIRKILEDFGRLSRDEENAQVPRQKKARTDSSNSLNKNISTNKPLNLCKKDSKDKEKPIKISKSVQSDISISGSILRTLLHSEECTENPTKNHSKEPRDKNNSRQSWADCCPKKTTKRSTAQQTDFNSFTEEKTEKSQPEPIARNEKWLNDPTVILKKIQKLKKDILYLDLLAEEKEKERIAILCFKNYKESILKKIFASDMSENVSHAQNNATDSPSTAIPKLIHPTENLVPNQNAFDEQRPLNAARAFFPSTAPLLQRRTSCSTPNHPSLGSNRVNDSYLRGRNSVDCNLLKANFFNSKFCNTWFCNPLCQAHSCSQHGKECGGFMEGSSPSK